MRRKVNAVTMSDTIVAYNTKQDSIINFIFAPLC